jgi:hypothetical protein
VGGWADPRVKPWDGRDAAERPSELHPHLCRLEEVTIQPRNFSVQLL